MHTRFEWTYRGGERVKRPKNAPTPCSSCPKIPRAAPLRTRQYAVEPTQLTRDIYEHWLECCAVGKHPDDELVSRHARLLQQVKEEVEREENDLLLKLLANATVTRQ